MHDDEVVNDVKAETSEYDDGADYADDNHGDNDHGNDDTSVA